MVPRSIPTTAKYSAGDGIEDSVACVRKRQGGLLNLVMTLGCGGIAPIAGVPRMHCLIRFFCNIYQAKKNCNAYENVFGMSNSKFHGHPIFFG